MLDDVGVVKWRAIKNNLIFHKSAHTLRDFHNLNFTTYLLIICAVNGLVLSSNNCLDLISERPNFTML